ncbi:MAG: hypothetical protein BJ554DRAFT_3316 [Olpidium bornovanus]|uniref:Uncharacterized protein n=1 Tax=Olpidium bornovanus TaxID=278681 RepID=A0A8H8DFR2_9FUNG|nr:MAG: hypothetical protein BJ554DRAFT_3316 [Olpidium bornovanus]
MTELLDHAEDVVPPATVQARGVLPELIDDLVHLERGQNRLDQHGGTDRTARHPQHVLRHVEYVVPQPRLQVRLHLGKVEVRPETHLNGLFGVVEEIDRKIKNGSRAGLPVNQDMLLFHMPATRAAAKRQKKQRQVVQE